MSHRNDQFAMGERPRLDVKLAAGRVRVLGGEPGNVKLRIEGRSPEEFVVEQSGETLSVRQPSERSLGRGSYLITLHAPPEAEVEVSLASADLDVETTIAQLRASAASGDIRTQKVTGDVNVKSASGDVSVEQVGGRARLTSASGDIRVEGLGGPGSVSTASGDIRFVSAARDLQLKTASGNVAVETFAGAEIDCKTVSGDLWVGLPQGRRIEIDLQTLSGSVRLPEGRKEDASNGDEAPLRIRFRSMSGDVRLERA